MSNILKIKKGDMVKIRIGAHKGKIAKVTGVVPAKRGVLVEGIGVRKRNVKPSQANPRGGTKEIHVPFDVSKVSLVVDGKSKTSRVGMIVKKDGTKARVARQLKNKEIA